MLGIKSKSIEEQKASLSKAKILVLQSAINFHKKEMIGLAEECHILYQQMKHEIKTNDDSLADSIECIANSLDAISSVRKLEITHEAATSALESLNSLCVKLFSCPQSAKATA